MQESLPFYELGWLDERQGRFSPPGGRRRGRSPGEGAGLRSPCGIPPSDPLPGRKVLPMCLA